MGKIDEISHELGEVSRGIKTLARNQEKILEDLQEVKTGLAVHVEREAALEDRLTQVEAREYSRPNYTFLEMIRLPQFWAAVISVRGLIATILGLKPPTF